MLARRSSLTTPALLRISQGCFGRTNATMIHHTVYVGLQTMNASRCARLQSGYESHSSGSGAGSTSTEDAEDKLLEEEEFKNMDTMQDVYMPIAYRLAGKADALDMELQRIRYVLFHKRQLLTDTAAATLTGRPSSIRRVYNRVVQDSSNSTTKESSGVTCSETRACHGNLGQVELYTRWKGSSSPTIRWVGVLLGVHKRSCVPRDEGISAHELVPLDRDLHYLRHGIALHGLNYYSRMHLVPKRNLWHAVYHVSWNMWVGCQNAAGCTAFGAIRGAKNHGWLLGVPIGAATGAAKGILFLACAFVVSPVVHLPRGLCNSLYGALNFFYGRYLFDAGSGRWMRCTVADGKVLSHAFQLEKRLIRAIGRAEFSRKQMVGETRWAKRLTAMGFSLEDVQQKMKRPSRANATDKAASDGILDPYEVMQVGRTATTQQIKAQYKRLALHFHPDVAQSSNGSSLSEDERLEMQSKFEKLSSAYQILANPEKRRAYDMGGAAALRLHDTKFGHFMSRTPEEMIQSLFGGERFRRQVVGELLRSHWSLRNEARVSVSLHEFEELQGIRVRQLAMELAKIVDVHAQRPPVPFERQSKSGVISSLPSTLTGHHSGYKVGNQQGKDPLKRPYRGPVRSTSSPVSHSVKDHEFHECLVAELGGRQVQSDKHGNRHANGVSSKRDGNKPDDVRNHSPFVLRPGSNEFNRFSRDFEERCNKWVSALSEACFGKELLHEVGEAYVIHAQRFLGILPFYSSKSLVYRKIFSGINRVWAAFQDKTPGEQEELTRRLMVEYLNMEYDAVVADLHVALRYTVQTVLQDEAVEEDVRRRRCYAVWRLGEKMMEKGVPWCNSKRDDTELIAYVQQAATSSATTSHTPQF